MKELESERKILSLERELLERQKVDLSTEKDMMESVSTVMNAQLRAHMQGHGQVFHFYFNLLARIISLMVHGIDISDWKTRHLKSE